MNLSNYGNFDFIFYIGSWLPFLIFVFVIFFILGRLFKGGLQWNKNNHSPVLHVDAKLVSKRTNVRRGVRTQQHRGTTSTTYFATFEFESGDRTEFSVDGSEYGQLAEGDTGKLKFQGTRYLSFERTRTM